MAGEQIRTRRDGLVSHATYLMNLAPAVGQPPFALFLDFFPASAGARGSAFTTGERFEAELVYYPGPAPLRAVLSNRKPVEAEFAWPGFAEDPLDEAARFIAAAPWETTTPVLLPEGRVVLCEKGKAWWRATSGDVALPLSQPPRDAVLGIVLERSAALWDGVRLSLLSSKTAWGLVADA